MSDGNRGRGRAMLAVEHVGQRIRAWRLKRGYTQDQVAAAIGITQTALSHYETGKRRLLLSTTLALAGALDVPVCELVDSERPDELAIPRQSRLGRLIAQLMERPELLKALGEAAEPIAGARSAEADRRGEVAPAASPLASEPAEEATSRFPTDVSTNAVSTGRALAGARR